MTRDGYRSLLEPIRNPWPLSRSKRAADLVLGLLLSVITAPLVLVLAVVSSARFRAFPLFVQERVGLRGETIRCIKIRTLSPHVPAYLDREELRDHGDEGRWAERLRRLHLDELPQFWQAVIGTFSLVGPRPMIRTIVDRMPDDVAVVRHSVRPGITGPWQISVDGSTLLEDTCDYDLAYVRHASPLADLRMLVSTAGQAVGLKSRSKKYVFDLMGVEPGEPHVDPLDLDGLPADSRVSTVRAPLEPPSLATNDAPQVPPINLCRVPEVTNAPAHKNGTADNHSPDENAPSVNMSSEQVTRAARRVS